MPAVRPVEGAQVGEAQAPRGLSPVPVRGQDREGQAQIVDLALAHRPPVVRGVEEVGHPAGGVATGDRRARHAGETKRTAGLDRPRRGIRNRVVEVLGHLLELVGSNPLHRASGLFFHR